MKPHPLAELFPLLSDQELVGIVADIKKNGLNHPIVTLDGMILDGRNRYRACQLAGVNPIFTTYKGRDARGYVLSENLHRRHLTVSQLSEIGARLATRTTGVTGGSNDTTSPMTNEEAATKMGVSVPSVKRAKKMLEVATPSEIKAVKAGKKTVTEVLTAHEEKEKVEDVVYHDHTEIERAIPAEILLLWQRAEQLAADLLSHTRAIKSAMKSGIEDREKDLVWIDCTNTDVSPIQSVINTITLSVNPHAVCPTCNGTKTRKNCKLCRGRGYIGRHLWTTCVDADTKKMLAKAK